MKPSAADEFDDETRGGARSPEQADEPREAPPTGDALKTSFTGTGRSDAADSAIGLVPGQQLGEYEIVRALGGGGMGTVYEARQQDPARTVALKVMNPALTSARALKRFQDEAEILARLQHPGIAQVYAAGMAEVGVFQIPYFAMELVPFAATLTEYAYRHELSLRQRLRLFVQVGSAVHHAHLSGVIHRDLKPANILVPDRPVDGTSPRAADSAELPQPKVIDFGVAWFAEAGGPNEPHVRPGDIVGTPAYMSPEQARADGTPIDARADVFALGVILYELLTEQRPFGENEGVRACLERIMHDEPTRPARLNKAIDGGLESIVLKALRKDLRGRYASVDDFAAELERYLAGEPVEAWRGSTVHRLRKTLRRLWR